jgi:TPR repeat protein
MSDNEYTIESLYHLIGWYVDQVLRDEEIAIKLYELQMECFPDNGHTRISIYNIAHILRNKDKKRAIQLFESIADDDLDAIYMLGSLHELSNWEVCDKWWELGAEKGDGQCLNKMGEKYLYGHRGAEKDAYKALECFEKAAAKKCNKAYVNMSKYYQNGYANFNVDPHKEAEWLEKIPYNKLGQVHKFNLGWYYLEKTFSIEKQNKGIKMMNELVDEYDDFDAMFMIGKAHAKGWGDYKINEEEGVKWYKRAAEAGDYVACIELLRYTTGEEHLMYLKRGMRIRNDRYWEYRGRSEFPEYKKFSVEVYSLLKIIQELDQALKQIEEYELRPPLIGGRLFREARDRFTHVTEK